MRMIGTKTWNGDSAKTQIVFEINLCATRSENLSVVSGRMPERIQALLYSPS